MSENSESKHSVSNLTDIKINLNHQLNDGDLKEKVLNLEIENEEYKKNVAMLKSKRLKDKEEYELKLEKTKQ